MTRPIEKVERGAGCQLSMLLLNIFIMILFIYVGISDYLKTKHNLTNRITLYVTIFSFLFFISTVLFYALTMINPGYV